ncbi:hypothetical protein Tco_1043658 [Tanacetum coccineum]|uniref:Uncharacterized protein n=1 Tax=Tanacetum coccineum TaxID=301880 RepID=A0ABQ5GMN6_9ASTR
MVLIVEDKATLVPHSESKLDMDVAQDDPNENNVEDCINLIRNDLDKLKLFLSKVKDLKKELEIDAPSQNAPQKRMHYEDLLGGKAPVIVTIKNLKKCPNKCHRIFKGAAEKDDALYEANKRASKDKNIDAEEEEVNEYEEDSES